MKKIIFFNFNKTYRKYGFFGIVLLFISFLSIAIGIYITTIFITKISTSVGIIGNGEHIDEQLTGVVGDFIGGIVGTIFSFAGVILFFLALRLQSKELSLQLKELKDTREVFSIQQFENTFFNLLKNQNEIRLSTELKERNYNSRLEEYQYNYFKGYSAFERIKEFMFNKRDNMNSNFTKAEKVMTGESDLSKEKVDIFLDRLNEHYSFSFEEFKENPLLKSKVIYKETFKEYNNQLSHYFRNIYHILLYIKENEELELSNNFMDEMSGEKIGILINKENLEEARIKRKYKKYSQFLQAQMSSTELLLLFYNALFFPNAKRLVQYYDLIENLNIDDLLYPDIDVSNYNEYQTNWEIIPKSNLKRRDDIMIVK